MKHGSIKALSIRQPWAWLIVNGWKDIENRVWRANHRGRLLIHAGKNPVSRADLAFAVDLCKKIKVPAPPAFDQLPFGGIIGEVEVVNCVEESKSPWFEGPFGIVLAKPRELPFHPMRGCLGLFGVQLSDLPAEYRARR